MKKTILAGMLLASLGTTFINAKFSKPGVPDEKKWLFERCEVKYVTKKSGDCTETYKVTTTYSLWWVVATCKTLVSKNCKVITPPNGGGGTGSNKQ